MTVWIALALSLLVSLITVLASRGVIPNNGLVGIRTPAITYSDNSWRQGHAAATPVIIATTVIVVFGAILLLIVTRDSTTDATNFAGLGLLALEVVGIVAAAIRGNKYASRDLQNQP
ncbi:SdpI family protein [Cryobacterium sp. PH31-L1]|uniref:SdpI family protein n=1 Tax=Cryobacterium sp. PH31-L1 TaxID=3046199 RepID=UPI0024BA4BDF|nr:SdpI family protein [Cryobacterium sp. PH31-L1]MDJ0376263.1 SdpI family protein [Cryobacterium sp. PH31-L1]